MQRCTSCSRAAALSTSMPCPAGDMNPIHLHPVLARLFGFKSNIAHGHLVLAQALSAIQAKEPGKPWCQAPECIVWTFCSTRRAVHAALQA